MKTVHCKIMCCIALSLVTRPWLQLLTKQGEISNPEIQLKKKKIELLNCLQLMSIIFHIVYAQAAFWLFFRGLTENNENCFFRRQQPVLWESLTYSACSLYIETNAMHSLSQNVRNVREHQKFFQVFSNDQRVY